VAAFAYQRWSRSGGSDDDQESGHHHWQAPAAEAARRNPVAYDKPSIDEGRKLYGTYCAACHGDQGRGDGPAGAALSPRPSDLTHTSEHHRDGDLAWKIATGKPPMPGWKGTLSETQIWHVVNYLKSTSWQHSSGRSGDQGRHR